MHSTIRTISLLSTIVPPDDVPRHLGSNVSARPLLVLFKRRGLIESVESEIAKLAAAGLYLSDSIKTTILFEAGESTPSK